MANSFQLKGRMFTLSVLTLTENNLETVAEQIQEKIKLAPNFFQHAPVVIDISELSHTSHPVDFGKLKTILKEAKLIPVGIKGLTEKNLESALTHGFAKMTDNFAEPSVKTSSPPQNPNLIITHPIRSGQQVYAQNGDLIVLSSVSPGAELLADGNIHVYGTLRGRILAGVNGDSNARIFCHRLEAELVAIAGHYKVFEELNNQYDHASKQIYLKDEQLIVENL